MDPAHLLGNIKPEHLISVAAAFIVAISACASLIISANSKIDRISSRFRQTCESWRKEKACPSDNKRRPEYLNDQINHFFKRYITIQQVQKDLFNAIRLFIGAYFFYAVTGGLVAVNMASPDSAHPPEWLVISIEVTAVAIAALFIGGVSLMLRAAHQQVKESAESHETLKWERKDIDDFYSQDAPNNSTAAVAGGGRAD